MSVANTVGLILAIAIGIFLFVTLFLPERF
ncbi:potassium-transporting ATPase subunit F [Mycolicibacterium iranicum]|uniref:ATPase n=1 Tax=Mycolicibacterium iranicum TaxID=912594 RepID=A0A1X1W528_MYCIR|nr:potassium-transporting ATPase subunit F [Mycolicibacterium iranicum]MCZ0732135.1 potassium-transporting ATPase subunit F [Mycolicibacterium iranicum]ORV81664.1 ATPase [Mycolicibacterium iranicum]